MTKSFILMVCLLVVSGCVVANKRLSKVSLPAPPSSPAVLLSWDVVDDPAVDGYVIYVGAASRSYSEAITVTPVTNNSVIFGPLDPKSTYYFAVTSTTTNGLESEYSAEVSFALPINVLYTIQMQTATNLAGPFSDFGAPLTLLTNPASPQLFFRLQINRTNF